MIEDTNHGGGTPVEEDWLNPERVRRQLLTGRLLVLQSKRIMLSSLQRRLEETGLDTLRERVHQLRVEADAAHYHYKRSMIMWGGPAQPDYWPIAYARLGEIGSALARSLTMAIDQLPSDEQYEAAIDVEMLERIVERWTQSMREAMARSVA